MKFHVWNIRHAEDGALDRLMEAGYRRDIPILSPVCWPAAVLPLPKRQQNASAVRNFLSIPPS